MNQVIACEFCMKKGNVFKICCPQKENQLYLLNTALEKLKNISSQKIPLLNFKNQNSDKFSSLNQQHAISDGSIDTISKNQTFRKITNRLRNMKKYYPKLYHCSSSIIEEWGRNSFHSVKPEILELNPKESSYFWV